MSTAHDLGDPAGLQATPPQEAREAGLAEHAMGTVRFCFLTGEGASQRGGHSDVSLAPELRLGRNAGARTGGTADVRD